MDLESPRVTVAMPAKSLYASQEEAVRHLKPGDMVFFHEKTPRSKLIQRVTGSYWNHVALVFDVPDISANEHDVLIVEALWHVEIHRLTTYLHRPDQCELGFKRLSCLTDTERERFRGFFLDAVDRPYDTLRLVAYFFKSWLIRLYGINATADMSRRYTDTNNFICTSFAQRAYYLAVAPEKRGSVLFRGHEKGLDFLQLMEQISPSDMARSKNSEWLFNPHH